MFYPEELVEEVRTRNNIVDVIGSYVKLQKKGSSYFGLCPFHNEKSPSFSVSGDKQMYYCFGCGAGGNVISFLMQYENLSFPEALQSLADRAGITLPTAEPTGEERARANKKTQLLELQKEAATYYYRLLRSEEGKRGLDYLTGRGLSLETIQSFGLGYAPAYSNRLYKFLKSKGYSDSLLNESGLVKIDERGANDRFWNRVIFPIMDANNRVIGFGGRVMGDGEPKYLNSPETLIFDKSRNLYGLHAARRSRKSYLLICEGYMDVISMHQAGFTNSVASLGTAFTTQHGLLIKRYTDEVILTYDSDEAGVKAAMRAIPILKEAGLSMRVLNMKPYKDPDEFIKNLGAEEFQKRIDQAQNSFLFEISVLRRQYDLSDPEEKTRFYNAIAEKLTGFTEELERANYTEAVAREYQIPLESLQKLVRAKGQTITQTQTAKPITRERKATREENVENAIRKSQRLLLTWISEEPEVYRKIEQVVTPEDFTVDLYRRIAERLFAQAKTGSVNAAELLNHFLEEDDYAEAAQVFQTRLKEQLDGRAREVAFRETVQKIKMHSLESALRSETDLAKIQKLVVEKQKLQHLNISLS